MGPEARTWGRRGAIGVWLLVGAVLGGALLAPAASAAKRPRLLITAKPAVVETGARIVVSGRVMGRLAKPARSLRVRAQRRVGTRWRSATSVRVARRGRFTVRWRAPARAGRLQLRLRLMRGKRVLATSRAWRLTVTRPAAPPPGLGPVAPGGSPASPVPAPPATTLVITPAVVADAPEPGQPGVLVLNGVIAVKAGDVLAAGIGPQTPFGFLLKATAVRVEAGRTVVDAVPATLLEAIPEGEIHESFTSSRARRGRSTRARFRRAVVCEAGGTVTIEGSADLGSPTWTIDADWGFLRLNSVKATTSIGASAHASAEATGTASCTVGPIKILERRFAPITFTIGPIPVVIVPELEIDLDGLGQIDANVATSVDASITATAGAEYEDGRLSPIAEHAESFNHQPPDPQAAAKLQATLSSALEAKFYGAGGPEVGLDAGLLMNADYDAPDPWWTLDAPVALTAGLDIDVLDIEAGPITVYEKSFRLAEAPPRLPRYRIVAGTYRYTAEGSRSCSFVSPDDQCVQSGAFKTLSIAGDFQADADLSVTGPSDYASAESGSSIITAPASIGSWAFNESYSDSYRDIDDVGPVCSRSTTLSDVEPGSSHGLMIGRLQYDPERRYEPEFIVPTDADLRRESGLGRGLAYLDNITPSVSTTSSDTAGCDGEASTSPPQRINYPNQFGDRYGIPPARLVSLDTAKTYGPPRCTGAVCVVRVSGQLGERGSLTGANSSRTYDSSVDWWLDIEISPAE